MKNFIIISSICLANVAFAQDTKKDTIISGSMNDYGARIYDARIGRAMSADPNGGTAYQNAEPEVSVTVINAVEKTACDCMNKVDIKTLTSPEQRKEAMNNCLRYAAKENETIINADKNAQPQKGYDAGKQFGIALGKKLGQLLLSNCPNFKVLTN